MVNKYCNRDLSDLMFLKQLYLLETKRRTKVKAFFKLCKLFTLKKVNLITKCNPTRLPAYSVSKKFLELC